MLTSGGMTPWLILLIFEKTDSDYESVAFFLFFFPFYFVGAFPASRIFSLIKSYALIDTDYIMDIIL